MKECFPKEDISERMFYSSEHVKRHMMFRRNINMISQTVGTWTLICIAPPHYSSQGHTCIILPYIPLMSSACGEDIERNWQKKFSWVSFSFLPLLRYWQALQFILDSIALVVSSVFSAKRTDWTSCTDSYLVFATGLNCWYPDNEDWTCLQRTISN